MPWQKGLLQVTKQYIFSHAFIFKNNPKHFEDASNEKADGMKNFNTNI